VSKEFGGMRFSFALEEGIVIIRNNQGQKCLAREDRVGTFTHGNRAWFFCLTEDFVYSENQFFYSFCLYSLIAHFVLAVSFSFFPPVSAPVKTEEVKIDNEKLVKFLEKLKRKRPKKEPVKVAKKVIKKSRKVARRTLPKPQKRKQFTQKISKKPKVAHSKNHRIKIVRRVKPKGPSKSQLKRRAVAKARAVVKAKAMNALNFLSSATGSFSVKISSNDSDYSNSVKGVKVAKGRTALGQMANQHERVPVRTRGVREIASVSSVSTSRYGKTLNGVQGGVASSRVHHKGSINLGKSGMTLTGARISQSVIERTLAKYLNELRFLL